MISLNMQHLLFRRCAHYDNSSLLRSYSLHKKRNLSIFNKVFIGTPTSSSNSSSSSSSSSKYYNQIQNDLDRAIKLVQKHDPVGYLPGLLVTKEARIGYFAVRAFWIDSGLRFKEDPFSNSISASRQIAGLGQQGVEIKDDERLEKWHTGIDALFDDDSSIWSTDPTLRLLHYVIYHHNHHHQTLSKEHFDRILLGRKVDVSENQYSTVESLKDHVEMSCGSLLYLVLECANIHEKNNENKPIYDAAKHIGITHGLANALRLSVPKASSTGKIIIPQDLCEKYGVRSPRYLLSALGMGDEECKTQLQHAVRDIVEEARFHLKEGRMYMDEIKRLSNGDNALSTFLPALASETFLNRLERHEYQLTDRKLRSVGFSEHMSCVAKITKASFTREY